MVRPLTCSANKVVRPWTLLVLKVIENLSRNLCYKPDGCRGYTTKYALTEKKICFHFTLRYLQSTYPDFCLEEAYMNQKVKLS